MPANHLRFLTFLLLLLTTACSGAKTTMARPQAKTCLVLSVGGVDGLAHLGVLQALQTRKVPNDCVYGNSMGALVGALYVSAPTEDPPQRWHKFIARYEQRAHSEWEQRGALDKFVSWVRGDLPKELDLGRLERTLHDLTGGMDLAQTAVPFATSYQQVQGTGVKLVVARQGELAHAVTRSANNLLLFPGAIRQGSQLDPGTDRVARVPVEDACATFPGHRLLVINVTGEAAYYRPDLPCPVQELLIPLRQTPLSAFGGQGEAFAAVVSAGRKAVEAGL